jgi:hypothetical protein
VNSDFRHAIRRALQQRCSTNFLKRSLPPITKENFQALCRYAGFKSVKAFARHIGRNDKTLWCAVRWPERYGPTMKLLRFWLTKKHGGAK